MDLTVFLYAFGIVLGLAALGGVVFATVPVGALTVLIYPVAASMLVAWLVGVLTAGEALGGFAGFIAAVVFLLVPWAAFAIAESVIDWAECERDEP